MATAQTASDERSGRSGQASAPTEPPVTGRTWIATAVVLTAVFMELMDVTMANVAVPSIRVDLGASYGAAQWVVAGYSLTFAVGLLSGGRLGDIYGRKKMFLAGLVGFLAASLLCGTSPNPGFLVVARVLQGLTAAVMLPQVLASISVWFPKDKRAAAFGLFGAVAGIGGIVAPLIAGVLIDADIRSLGWRSVFLINLPIGVVVFLVGLSAMDESKSPIVLRPDPIGAVVGAVAVFLLVFPVIQGEEAGWPIWTWVLLALCAPALVAFVAVERWKTRRDGSPVVQLSLFRDRGFAAGLLVTLVFFAGVTALAFVLMVTLQVGLGYDALHAGATLTPLAIGLVVGSGLSVALSKKLGKLTLQLGCLVALSGVIWLSGVVGKFGTSLASLDMVLPVALLGIGLGVVVAPLSDFVLAGIRPQDAGSASGLQSTMIQAGSAIGLAALGAIFFEYLGDNVGFPGSLQRVLYVDAAVFAVTAVLVLLIPARRPIDAD